jgi:hypothetical protein
MARPRAIGMPFGYRVLRRAVLAMHAHIFGTRFYTVISHLFFELYLRPRLLHLDRDVNQSPQNYQEEHEPHQDERQIRLDTDRSFVLYPVGDAHPDPASFHFHPYRFCRRQSGRRSAHSPGRAQQTHRQSFPTTSGFELLSGQPVFVIQSTPLSLFQPRCTCRASMTLPLSYSLHYPLKLLSMH